MQVKPSRQPGLVLSVALSLWGCIAIPVQAQQPAPAGAQDPTELHQQMEQALKQQEDRTLEAFLKEELIPQESVYFKPGIGIDAASAIPYDHVRVRMNNQKLAETGHYTAGSKLSVYIPYLLKVALGHPLMHKAAHRPAEARRFLKQTLRVLEQFQQEYPDFDGFFPWMEIRSQGRLAPSGNQVPSLDNGQLTWALAAIVGALEGSSSKEDQELVAMARRLIDRHNYARFYDPSMKRMRGLAEIQVTTGKWVPHPTYQLMDMFEGTMAVLWAVLHKQVPRDAWDNLEITPIDYHAQDGQLVTTLRGYRGSFHEHWGLLFLPLLDTPLGMLYQDYLYAHADYAHSKGLPGFLTTANDSRGVYRQMGVPALAQVPGERDDVAVLYATAMGLMIQQPVGARWLKHHYRMPGLVTRYGAVESAAGDGFADVMTADAKGIVLLAAAGGAVPELMRYLQSHPVPGEERTLYDYFKQLCSDKYKQLLAQRPQGRINPLRGAYPSPPLRYPEVRRLPLEDPGAVFSPSEHWSSGHLHGRNVRSLTKQTLEDDIRPGGIFGFEFYIPELLPEEDQWAYRGTYLDKPVSIAAMRFMAVTLPADAAPHHFDIELKRDNVLLAKAWIDTQREGTLSPDKQWKTVVLPFHPAPEAVVMPLNYISVVLHEPTNLRGIYAKHAREGSIRVKEVVLYREHPDAAMAKRYQDARLPAAPGAVELIRHWVPSHGGLAVQHDEVRGVYRFSAGNDWRGGTIPYTDLTGYTYMHVRIRNLSGQKNRIAVEVKRDQVGLFGGRFALELAADDQWRMKTIRLRQVPDQLLNYLAVANPQGDFELASISFSK